MTTTWTATLWTDDITPVDYDTVGEARLLWQYRDKPRLTGALTSLVEGLQPLEDVTFDIMVGRWPLTAVGAQLDVLGRLVGQERGGLLDAEYRLWILARGAVNRGNGRVDDLLAILEALGATGYVVRELYPANVVVETGIAAASYPASVAGILGGAKAGGVRLDFVYVYSRATAFQASGTYGSEEYSATQGAGSVYSATTGGQSAGSFTA